MNSIVELIQHEPFAQGGNRSCYVDPGNPDRCIKLMLKGKSAGEKRKAAAGLKRFRSLKYFDDNVREFETYQRLQATGNDELWKHLPRCHGMVNTDLGPGIVTDLIRNHDGSISKDLKARLRKCGRDHFFNEAVDELYRYMRRTSLPTRDLLLHNLVAQEFEERGRFSIHVIDGFGSSDALPLVYWSQRLARQKVERKIAKFPAKIEDFCQKYDIPNYDI